MDKLIIFLFVPFYLFSQDSQLSNKLKFIKVDYFLPLYCEDCRVEDSFDEFHSFYGASTLVQDDFFQWNQLLQYLESLNEESIESSSVFYNLKISAYYENNSESVIKIDEFNRLILTEGGDFKLTGEVLDLFNKLLCDQVKKENVRCVGIECNREVVNETCEAAD